MKKGIKGINYVCVVGSISGRGCIVEKEVVYMFVWGYFYVFMAGEIEDKMIVVFVLFV